MTQEIRTKANKYVHFLKLIIIDVSIIGSMYLESAEPRSALRSKKLETNKKYQEYEMIMYKTGHTELVEVRLYTSSSTGSD